MIEADDDAFALAFLFGFCVTTDHRVSYLRGGVALGALLCFHRPPSQYHTW